LRPPRPATRTTGVFPREAKVRALAGFSDSPDPSTKQTHAPSLRVTLYRRPLMASPVLDGPLVTFDGALGHRRFPAAAAVSYGQPWWRQPWGSLLDSVRTGLTAFDEVFHEPLFPFLARNPGAAAVFNANVTAMSAADATTLAEALGLNDVTAVVDVGGGHGVLGRAILNRYSPISVVVFDWPDVVAGAPYPVGTAEVVCANRRCQWPARGWQ
jgi:hypothetical protein